MDGYYISNKNVFHHHLKAKYEFFYIYKKAFLKKDSNKIDLFSNIHF